MPHTLTHQLELARMFIENTGKSLFLTGKAGTGKTTFLKRLKKDSPKRMIVVAPTGVAAINAGGVTIHSFFQLPFGPQIPNQYLQQHEKQPENNYRFSKEKLNIIRSIDLLVIDEISMVRADLLDAVDGVLQKLRQNSNPFGGVQVLMIGDLQQLAPVLKNDEQAILQKYYNGPFFFQSKVLEQFPVETIELKHIFRQKDEVFINILNEIRENKLSAQSFEMLKQRYQPGFNTAEGYITLTSHNNQANNINSKKLSELQNRAITYNAEVEGEFPSFSYPNDAALVLKKGAQVMFIKNDTSRDKLYFNGKIGVITDIWNDRIDVKCEDMEQPIEVKPVEWQNYKYSINDETNEIEETIIGKYTQIPLKLAWAITIHKSQGLTFDKVIIDSNAAFAHGQVYVALSRCRTLDGIVLSSPINPHSIISTESVNSFIVEAEKKVLDLSKIQLYQHEYEKKLIMELFDFSIVWKNMTWLERNINENKNVLFGKLVDELSKSLTVFKEKVLDVSQKFYLQLEQLLSQGLSVKENNKLQDRIKKGALYFYDSFNEILTPIIENPDFTTDNKNIRKNIIKNIEQVHQKYLTHLECLKACSEGFSISGYLSAKSVSNIEKVVTKIKLKKQPENFTSASVKNPELYQILRLWRKNKAETMNVPEYIVLQTKTIIDMSETLPSSFKELIKIKGFGKKKIETFGKELLLLIQDYKEKHGMENVIPDFTFENEKAKEEKKPTLDITFDLYRMGLDVKSIAEKRGLAVSTIFSHLTKGVTTGEVDIRKVIDENKIAVIRNWCLEYKPTTSTEVRNALGENYSYDEIRMVIADINSMSG